MAICDKDCFNCKFPDCILGSRESSPHKSASDRKRESKRKSVKKRIENGKNAESCRRYYQKHREEILKKKKSQYWAKKEAV